jgi:putative transposase
MTLWRRGMPKKVLVHSDRGSQYSSDAYRKLIAEHKLVQSMSRKGNCRDNACVESFFHTMKVEAVHDEPLMTREVMRQHIFEYIEVEYNKRRGHCTLGYLSPEQYELKNLS